MSSSDKASSQPNNIDFTNSDDYPTNPDTLNYNYAVATYNKPRPFESNYEKTNYDITNFPKTDYNKFNSDITNYTAVPNTPINETPFNFAMCQSPDMLYQGSSIGGEKYMCFNNYNKLLEIRKETDKWFVKDLTNSSSHIKWKGSQCKITTPDICNKDNLTENCKATCFVSPNQIVNIKFKNNIWRIPELEKNAGACAKTTVSEDTAQNSFCKCNNGLDQATLKTKPVFDEDYRGKFWCSPN